MIRIETERCKIRNFIESDIDEFIIYRNNESWMQYQGFKGLSREEYKSALLKDSSLEVGIQLAIVSKLNDGLIGDVYLNKSDNEYWIGYTISPSYARQGYAYEVVKGVIEWLKKQGAMKVCAGVLPKNIPSIMLLEKLGFVYSEMDESGEKIYLLEL
ncbi:GNAT family N-acetyltransferase [Wukongibacter baidiensis]|uniref:GNAT family N-acetyltransferase n=1 Tax=Wukongibacter baidiensis TaxID=1723361 RepID=UPI003D7F8997